jgi:uncharacterized protein involved in exopolysaccharide biosynthesis
MNAKQGQRWGIILAFLGFAIGIPGFWLLIAHDQFEVVVYVQAGGTTTDAKDVSFIQKETGELKSERVLSNVVNVLHLDTIWGDRYAKGRKLTMDEILPLLQQSVRTRVILEVPLIEISVSGQTADEVAGIANALTENLTQDAKNFPKRAYTRPLKIDHATPPADPLGPNRQLGKVLLGVGVLLLVCGFVTFVRNWRRPDEAAS